LAFTYENTKTYESTKFRLYVDSSIRDLVLKVNPFLCIIDSYEVGDFFDPFHDEAFF